MATEIANSKEEVQDTTVQTILGDIRSNSFIKSSREKAMEQYGITLSTIFTGVWVDKKYRGRDWTFKKRYIFIDPSKKTFNWSKIADIKDPKTKFKSIGLKKAKVRASHSTGFEIYFDSNNTGIMIEGLTVDVNNEWMKILQAMCGEK